MATFPVYATFQSSTFQQTPISNVVRSVSEDGTTKQRRRTVGRRTERRVRYLVTEANLPTFLTWLETDIAGGAQFFDWTDPVSDTVKSARIVNGDITIVPVTTIMEHYFIDMVLETFT